MEDYFELTEQGLVVNDNTIFLVPCFNELYKRDTSLDKALAYRELHYIFQVCDIRSTSVKKGLKGSILKRDAKVISRVPEDWKEDNVVRKCIKYYKEDRSNIIVTAYENMLHAFNTANKSIEFLNDTLNHKLEEVKASDDLLSSDTIKLITSSIRELLQLGIDIPARAKELSELKERALANNKSSNIGRGGIEVADSMNSTNSVLSRN